LEKKEWPFMIPITILVIAILFFVITKPQLQYSEEFESKSVGDHYTNIGEVRQGEIIEQDFVCNVDQITELSLYLATYGRKNVDILHVELLDARKNILLSCEIDTSNLTDNSLYPLPIKNSISGVKDQCLQLKIKSLKGVYGNAITLYCDSLNDSNFAARINEVKFDGSICVQLKGRNVIPFAKIYWVIVVIGVTFSLLYSIHVYRQEKKGQGTFLGNTIRGLIKYWFLLKQLVLRDFKTKYKRSVLGMFWSLLNPLLTMTVQYIVFSKLFRFDIANYPVYLLSGIVFFNYMSDATAQSMMCIVQNASLINKVYVPKYIYPFSRVLSCGVNFLLSLLALYIVILVTRLPITINHWAIIYGMACTFIFTLGVSLFLSALMVFFRDVQFLYSVFLQMWIYLTPLFYPESILPTAVMHIVECNPMYHFIRFIRIIILDGVLPEFKAWVYCAIFAIGTLILGYAVFKKLQKKFVLYI